MNGKLPGNHITSETSKRVRLRPQKETTPENLAFHEFKQKQMHTKELVLKGTKVALSHRCN